MQAPQSQHPGQVAHHNYVGPTHEIQQGIQPTYPHSYHSTYPDDVSQQQPYPTGQMHVSGANRSVNNPFSNQQIQQQMPYNQPYRQQVNQQQQPDMYASNQQSSYGGIGQSHYQATNTWERDNGQSYNVPPHSHPNMQQNGTIRQVHMPPPPHVGTHYVHQQLAASSPNHSPRSWANVNTGMIQQQSPRATPSPMASQQQGIPSPSLSNRSPAHNKQFSPSPGLSSINQNFDYSPHQTPSSSSSPSNSHATMTVQHKQQPPSSSTPADSHDPLQSLQKMVLIESQPAESPVERANYEVSSNSSIQSIPTSKGSSDFSNIEQLASNDYIDSPGPTYYNLDDGKTVNSKFTNSSVEETSRSSYTSDHGGNDNQFTNPQHPPLRQPVMHNMEQHCGYPQQPINGMPIGDSASTYPAPHPNHNGYNQPAYQPNTYNSNVNANTRSPRKKYNRKTDGVGKRGKKKAATTGDIAGLHGNTVYGPNYYPNSVSASYPANCYNGEMNLAYDANTANYDGDFCDMPSNGRRRRRMFTSKRGGRQRCEDPNAHMAGIVPHGTLDNKANLQAFTGDENCNGIKMAKSAQQQKGIDGICRPLDVVTAPHSNEIINGRASPSSISAFDGPVKITKVPNDIGVEENERSGVKESADKRPIIKEVSVRIVPLNVCDSNFRHEDSSNVTSYCSSASSTPVPNDNKNSIFGNAAESSRRDVKNGSDGLSIRHKKKSTKNIHDDDKEARRKPDYKCPPFSGPFIRIDPDNPISVAIINAPNKDDDKVTKHKKGHRHISNSCSPRRKSGGGHSSTLSAHYDTSTKDKTWVCALCHKGTHHNGLGDLFGPYYDSLRHDYVSAASPPPDPLIVKDVETVGNETDASPTQRTSLRTRRRRSELVEECIRSSAKRIRQGNRQDSTGSNSTCIANTSPINTNQASTKSSSSSSKPGDSSNAPTITDSLQHEFWVHEECILWADGVYVVGHKLVGIEEAVRYASEMICSNCDETGATLGCLSKNCCEQLHYLCAKQKGCDLNEDEFKMFCPQHKIAA